MKLLALLVVALLGGAPVFDGVTLDGVAAGPVGGASTYSWWVAGSETQIDGTAGTKYMNPFAPMTADITATQNLATIVVPTAGTLSDLRCDVDADLGSGTDQVVVNLQYNANALSAPTDSAVGCTITGGAGTSCTDADTLSVGAGDALVYRVTTVDTPNAVFNILTCRVKLTPTVPNQTVWGFHFAANNFSTSYFIPMGSSDPAGGEADAGMLIAGSGNITGLACAAATDLTGTSTQTIDFVVAGTPASDVACVLDDTHQECTDAGSIAVTAGQRVSIRNVPANEPPGSSQVACGAIFEPTTSGQWVTATFDSVGPGDATVWGKTPQGQVFGWSTFGEGVADSIYPNAIAKALYATVTTAPGSGGDARTFRLRESGADSALFCAITDAATSCNLAADVTIEANNKVNMQEAATIIGGSIAAAGITRTGVLWAPP